MGAQLAVRVAISMGKTEIGEVMIIGDIVTVIVDRQLGSYHPKHRKRSG